MAARKKQNKDYSYNRPNFWGMVRDIVIASMNKGLFLVTGLWILLFVLIVKLSPEDSRLILKEIFCIFTNWKILGWFLFLFSVIGWIYNTKS